MTTKFPSTHPINDTSDDPSYDPTHVLYIALPIETSNATYRALTDIPSKAPSNNPIFKPISYSDALK